MGKCSVIFALGLLFTAPQPASAFYKVCNRSGEDVFVAIGYNDDGAWLAEGWWQIADGRYDNIINEALVNQYYYIRAECEDGGVWEGDHMFCTNNQRFTLTDSDDCISTTINRQGFFEVDTGDSIDWTTTLTP